MQSLPVEEFESIDLIDPVNPARIAFTKEIASEIYKTHLVYRKTNKIKGTVFFIKNIKKHKNTELFFDEVTFNNNGKMLPGEDTEFAVSALMSGLGCYYTYNAIVNELGTNFSTWASSNEHSNIVTIYESINKKYQGNLFKIPEDTVKMFSHIGYSKAPDGKYVFRLALDPDERQKVFEKHNHTDVTFYEIPLMPVDDAMQYALTNIDDIVLRNLLNDLIRQKKTFTNRGKKRIKFNWDLVLPTLPDKIAINKNNPAM
jgi:hypothetical protein